MKQGRRRAGFEPRFASEVCDDGPKCTSVHPRGDGLSTCHDFDVAKPTNPAKNEAASWTVLHRVLSGALKKGFQAICIPNSAPEETKKQSAGSCCTWKFGGRMQLSNHSHLPSGTLFCLLRAGGVLGGVVGFLLSPVSHAANCSHQALGLGLMPDMGTHLSQEDGFRKRKTEGSGWEPVPM